MLFFFHSFMELLLGLMWKPNYKNVLWPLKFTCDLRKTEPPLFWGISRSISRKVGKSLKALEQKYDVLLAKEYLRNIYRLFKQLASTLGNNLSTGCLPAFLGGRKMELSSFNISRGWDVAWACAQTVAALWLPRPLSSPSPDTKPFTLPDCSTRSKSLKHLGFSCRYYIKNTTQIPRSK